MSRLEIPSLSTRLPPSCKPPTTWVLLSPRQGGVATTPPRYSGPDNCLSHDPLTLLLVAYSIGGPVLKSTTIAPATCS